MLSNFFSGFYAKREETRLSSSLFKWKWQQKKFGRHLCFVHPIFCLLVFCILVTLVAGFFFLFVFRLAHLTLQNVNKDYVIFSYFCNFVPKNIQKPKTKNGKKGTCINPHLIIWVLKSFLSLDIDCENWIFNNS